MYCRNCGNEILETDNYCEKCGTAISRKTESKDDNCDHQTTSYKQLSMNWWKFWQYVRFPLGIILSFFKISTYKYASFDLYILAFLIIDILMIIFTIYTYDLFMHKKKKGYSIFMFFLFIEAIYSCSFSTLNTALSNTTILEFWEFILSFILVLIIWGIIWVLPNYIYFKKRKQYFCN